LVEEATVVIEIYSCLYTCKRRDTRCVRRSGEYSIAVSRQMLHIMT
jgi:hypothetical protein